MSDDEINLENLARTVHGLYHESTDDQETPIYAELKNLDQRYKDPTDLAAGGMKNIKKVFDLSTSRHLALAELHDDIDQSFHEVFLREARLTALLEHPNIYFNT